MVDMFLVARLDEIFNEHISICENSFLGLLHVAEAFQLLSLSIFLMLRIDRLYINLLHSEDERLESAPVTLLAFLVASRFGGCGRFARCSTACALMLEPRSVLTVLDVVVGLIKKALGGDPLVHGVEHRSTVLSANIEAAGRDVMFAAAALVLTTAVGRVGKFSRGRRRRRLHFV